MVSDRQWDDIPDDFVLPPGDAKRGAKLFKKHCQQCHSLRPDNRQTSGMWLSSMLLAQFQWLLFSLDMCCCVAPVNEYRFFHSRTHTIQRVLSHCGSYWPRQHYWNHGYDAECGYCMERCEPNEVSIADASHSCFRYMKNPEQFVSSVIGMNFGGLSNFQDRVDIVHFLRDLTPDGVFGKRILQECKKSRWNGVLVCPGRDFAEALVYTVWY